GAGGGGGGGAGRVYIRALTCAKVADAHLRASPWPSWGSQACEAALAPTPLVFATPPSNVALSDVPHALWGPALSLPENCQATVDTGSADTPPSFYALVESCGLPEPYYGYLPQSGGEQVLVVAGPALKVPGTAALQVVGDYPLVWLVAGDAEVAGEIDAGAQGSLGGGGSASCDAQGLGEAGFSATGGNSAGGGGGGGGFGSAGAAGGSGDLEGGDAPATGYLSVPAAPGVDNGAAGLTPLRGGCAGGEGGDGASPKLGGHGGGGGGALQLSVAGTLTVSGKILVTGGGGERGQEADDATKRKRTGGGGGGSGGALLLEAAAVQFVGLPQLLAGGGGGASGCKDDDACTGGTDGADGRDPFGAINSENVSAQPASGGGSGTGAVSGGAGASLTRSLSLGTISLSAVDATAGTNADGNKVGGGGGGGGVGRVRINASQCDLALGASVTVNGALTTSGDCLP
ncbi:MAG: hypothetical protein ACO3JL_17190, partial [Myxococcota bacterium]